MTVLIATGLVSLVLILALMAAAPRVARRIGLMGLLYGGAAGFSKQ
jgi:hypothetical protein